MDSWKPRFSTLLALLVFFSFATFKPVPEYFGGMVHDWSANATIHRGVESSFCKLTSVIEAGVNSYIVCAILVLCFIEHLLTEVVIKSSSDDKESYINVTTKLQIKNSELRPLRSLVPKWVWDFNTCPSLSYFIYPSTLDTYVTEKTQKGISEEESMRYEWARYETFQKFPDNSPAMPSRLAQAGFFYTGNQDEVKCFSCGITHKDWQSSDSAFLLHRELSPSCRFVRGQTDANVTIHKEDNSGARFEEASRTLQQHVQITAAKNITPENTSSATTETTSTLSSYNSSINSSPSSAATRAPSAPTPATEHKNGQYRDPLGINHDRPKHPEFAVPTIRLSSYEHWPSAVSQTPAELAEAGFYYAGFGDCVRCFFCSGGLRNWEYGDDPWVEHARWYPECVFLNQCKGSEFVRHHQELLRQMSGSQSSEKETSKNNNEQTTNKHKETDPMYSAAALSVMEIGYPKEKVKAAVRKFAADRGHNGFAATDLLQIIFDMEDAENRSEVQEAKTDENTEPNTPAVQKNQTDIAPKESELAKSNKIEEKTTTKTSEEGISATDVKPGVTVDATSIMEENRQLKEHMMCKICMDNEACVVFLPCGHMVCCPQCAHALRKCAVCRKLIKGTVRAFIT